MTKHKVPDKGWTKSRGKKIGRLSEIVCMIGLGPTIGGQSVKTGFRPQDICVSQAPRCRASVRRIRDGTGGDTRRAGSARIATRRERRLIRRATMRVGIARTIRGAHYDRRQFKTSIVRSADGPGADMASTGRCCLHGARSSSRNAAKSDFPPGTLGDGFGRPCGGRGTFVPTTRSSFALCAIQAPVAWLQGQLETVLLRCILHQLLINVN